MALRNIVLEGDSILKKVCRPVTNFDGRLAELLDDMKETLTKAQGLGLAGPQVGILRRLCIVLEIDEDGEHEDENGDLVGEFLELVNPEILSMEGEATLYEGCLSFPGKDAEITRPNRVTFRAQDRTGAWYTRTVEGINARCVCHECNHLDGITIVDLAKTIVEEDA